MRLSKKIILLLAAVVIMVSVVHKARAARILIVQPVGNRSHKNFFLAIAESLVQRNHTVTIVTGYKSSRQIPDIREVFVPDGNIFDLMQNLFNVGITQLTWELLPSVITCCRQALSNKDVQALFKEEFDLVMINALMTDCFLSFVHKLKVPFIYVSPNVLHGGYSDLAGTPFFPSLIARYRLNLELPLSFGGRMVSTLYEVLDTWLYQRIYVPRVDADCRAHQLCPEDMPSLSDLRLNSSLFIVNSIRTLENPTLPTTPTVVHAGGMHCRPSKSLPEDLQQWVAEAGKSGFILFSLGSLVKSSTMPEKYQKVLLEVFGSLKQRVIWKWDEITMKGLPPNVRLSKWLPQQDLLGHSQIRLFITHGGLLSIHEATFHGVPVLGMPVILDQHQNMRKVQREGWGRVLDWKNLTYDNLRDHILHIMNDARMREEVQQRSMMMKDQPLLPKEWTTYWVEYVLRHQGAVHLRSPAGRVPWYQLYNVDVWTLVVVVTVMVVGLASLLAYKTLQVLVRWCCGSKKTKKD